MVGRVPVMMATSSRPATQPDEIPGAATNGHADHGLGPRGPDPAPLPADLAGARVVWSLVHGRELTDAACQRLPEPWLDLALTARDSRPPEGESTTPAEWKVRLVR